MSPLPIALGVVDQSPVPHGSDGREALERTLELARLCDRLGYSRYWLAEHHSTNSFAGSAPEVLIPRVASVTSHIRIGSGGVMLPHYSPYKVAEQFRVLETLFPGRIDLGLGRAPAGTGGAGRALRWGREAIPVERFPEQIDDLVGWLGERFPRDHPKHRVRATPRGRELPELWVLGSSGNTARIAAERGMAYCFAQFIGGKDGAEDVRGYREGFRAGEAGTEPRAAVAVGVISAETADEAERLALSLHLWRMRIIRGVDRGIPSPEQAEREFEAHGIEPAELGGDARIVTGDPESVRDQLVSLAGHYGVDEVITVTVTHDPEARRRSVELVAEAMELEPRAAVAGGDGGLGRERP